ncbi:MAG: PD-(D/E)XK motif protein [Spirochaetes bacterium]|uniref:PD-(D/E)XK motif protein n=1 Tax=Candidatus Ornithospirochaeta stercoripullorum TaxID=2840899 RepID=A0A9D9DYW6_9SPIO|nr:PD-(D/E)XK motif protein [Candidatus Ornithospirochaeta stercoripullorum]
MINIINLFKMLEDEYPSSHDDYTRKIDTPDQLPIYAGISAEKKSFISIKMDTNLIAISTDIVSCSGYDVRKYKINETEFDFRLIICDLQNKSIFYTVIQDLVDSVSFIGSSVEILINRLRRWNIFFKHSPSGVLSKKNQIGLFGELCFIKDNIARSNGLIINCWNGPKGESKDFMFDSFAVEVKTSSQEDHQTIRISNENQLDKAGLKELYLIFNIVNEDQMDGSTLPEFIKEIKVLLKKHHIMIEKFEELLFGIGYDDRFSELYTERFIRSASWIFNVNDDFPKIIPADLAKGISNVSYSVDFSICKNFDGRNILENSLGGYFK